MALTPDRPDFFDPGDAEDPGLMDEGADDIKPLDTKPAEPSILEDLEDDMPGIPKEGE